MLLVIGSKPSVEDSVHGVMVLPFSNPGSPSNCAAVHPPPEPDETVSVYVTAWVPDAAVPVMVIG